VPISGSLHEGHQEKIAISEVRTESAMKYANEDYGGANFFLVLIWTIVIGFAVYHGIEMQHQFWAVADSSPQQAAIATYRTGMIGLSYVMGRGLTEAIKLINSIATNG